MRFLIHIHLHSPIWDYIIVAHYEKYVNSVCDTCHSQARLCVIFACFVRGMKIPIFRSFFRESERHINKCTLFSQKSNKKTIARGYRFGIKIISFVCSEITAKIRPIVSDLQNFPKTRYFAISAP